MSLEAMLTLISLWCGGTDGTAKWACQSRMTVCIQREFKKSKESFQPIFLKCWNETMK